MTQFTEENIWTIVENFNLAFHSFEQVYQKYEIQVNKISGSDEDSLQRGLASLDLQQLEYLLPQRKLCYVLENYLQELREICQLKQLQELSDNIFAHYIGDIFHELSILVEECSRILLHGPEYLEYRDDQEFLSILEEIQVFLPLKMLHLSQLFIKGKKELEQLLPSYRDSQILLRSTYLFGKRVIAPVYQSVENFLEILFPQEGYLYGYLQIIQSFLHSRFDHQAQQLLIEVQQLCEQAPSQEKSLQIQEKLQTIQTQLKLHKREISHPLAE